MYYIVIRLGKVKYSVVQVTGEVTDATYHKLQEVMLEVRGQHGRRDYATAWCSFYNKEITRKELHQKLGINEDKNDQNNNQ